MSARPTDYLWLRGELEDRFVALASAHSQEEREQRARDLSSFIIILIHRAVDAGCMEAQS